VLFIQNDQLKNLKDMALDIEKKEQARPGFNDHKFLKDAHKVIMN